MVINAVTLLKETNMMIQSKDFSLCGQGRPPS